MRVLIIEDEAILALEYEILLEDLGCEPVGVAHDSATALRMAAALRPDLALVDINLLDGMTGGDVGQALARDNGVAVLYVTSEARHVDLRPDGVLGSLAKPFTAKVFAEAINWAREVVAGDRAAPAPAGVITARR